MSTMKELIAKATPGPWGVHPHPADRTVLVYGPLPVQPLVAECSPRTRLGQIECDANAQLISRCNPATMALVLEALEEITHIDGLSSLRIRQNIERCQSALKALNNPSP